MYENCKENLHVDTDHSWELKGFKYNYNYFHFTVDPGRARKKYEIQLALWDWTRMWLIWDVPKGQASKKCCLPGREIYFPPDDWTGQAYSVSP